MVNEEEAVQVRSKSGPTSWPSSLLLIGQPCKGEGGPYGGCREGLGVC